MYKKNVSTLGKKQMFAIIKCSPAIYDDFQILGTTLAFHCRAPENDTFRVTLGDTELGHGVRHSNLIIFLLSCRHRHCTALSWSVTGGVGWGGLGWGNNVHVPVHTKAQQLAVLQTQALRCSFMISCRWGAVGWGG